MRPILYALLAVVLIGAGWVGFSVYRGSQNAAFGDPFALVDHNGKEITQADFRAQPSAVFFGFTHCPEVCPTTLFELSGLLKELGDDGKNLRVFFVSVDPERDTPQVLGQYVTSVSDRITGVTGPLEDVEKMLKSYKVYWRKQPTEDGYTMDHTASIYLLSKGGGFEGTIAYQENHDTALQKLRRLANG
ncbi:MAG TPA: SCO family protein [Rhizobiaceae bacterium]|nr:SCO family protein [Rhizobiaceae bacterium]